MSKSIKVEIAQLDKRVEIENVLEAWKVELLAMGWTIDRAGMLWIVFGIALRRYLYDMMVTDQVKGANESTGNAKASVAWDRPQVVWCIQASVLFQTL